MVSLWAKGVRKPLVAKRSREKAEQSRADKWPSHDLVEIRITSERALKFRNPRQFWCLVCMAKMAGYGAGNSRPKIEGACTETRNLPRQTKGESSLESHLSRDPSWRFTSQSIRDCTSGLETSWKTGTWKLSLDLCKRFALTQTAVQVLGMF